MSHRDAIEHALTCAGIADRVESIQSLSGGCIHHVSLVMLSGGRRVVAKANADSALGMFNEESHNLAALAATATVLVPQPLAVVAHDGTAVVLMTAIDLASPLPDRRTWEQFGRDLAALHRCKAGNRYGFDQDNHIGSTPQPNAWCDDWVEFNAVNRLGYQVALAHDNELLDQRETQTLEAVIQRLDRLIPRDPKPALLHGDLWSGNALPGVDSSRQTRIAVIDPACSIGDGWADIAMMHLFGGFPDPCFNAYAEVVGRPADVESRLAVYQLYHVLNHVNLFGRGYAGQALQLAARLERIG